MSRRRPRRRAPEPPRVRRFPMVSANTRNYVKRAIKASTQKHYWNVHAATPVAFDESGTIVDLLKPTQGDSHVSRDGDEIRLRSMEFRYDWQFNTGGTNPQPWRLLIFSYKSDDVPIISDVLLNTDTGDAVNSAFNQDNRVNYKILHDKRMAASGGSAGGGTGVFFASKKLIKKVTFIGAGTGGHNKIYMMALSNTSTAADQPELRYDSTIFFDP